MAAGSGIAIFCDNYPRDAMLWVITFTVPLTSARLVVRKSVDDTHGIARSLCDS